MNKHCRLINNGKTNQDDDKISLTAFDGKHNNCGKPCHLAKDFRARERTTKFKGKCHDCVRPGHKT